jgi:hypothetical protein
MLLNLDLFVGHLIGKVCQGLGVATPLVFLIAFLLK